MGNNYVVNLHILEQCNYKCRYCFAHYESKNILTIDKWREIVDNICAAMPVKRFNIAGGEPLLYPRINELIEYIKSKGVGVSIITNGFLLSEYFIESNADNLETIGISVDSFCEETLSDLGCKTSRDDILSRERLLKLSKTIKEAGIKLKINTVVTKGNYKEEMSSNLAEMNIDRWKILKMKPFRNDSFTNFDLNITDEEFQYFLETNDGIENRVVEQSMDNSYIIIDSSGYLLDHSGENYKRVADAKLESFKDDFRKFNLNEELYQSRYN